MVPFACLLVLLPLALAGQMDNEMMQHMMQQQMMQQMMQQQQQQQGWGGWGGWGGNMQQGHNGGDNGGNWWGMQSKEDYEAYLKWCEERKAALHEQQQQQELLKQWEKKEMERQKEVERKRVEMEAHERQENMMAQWKMWQQRLNQQHEFDDLLYKFAELKHAYMFTVTMEFLKFCKCSDFTEDMQRLFVHADLHYDGGHDFDLDDLDGIDSTNPDEVARALANRPRVDQVKAFFGGLAESMCLAARAYVESVRDMDLDGLM